MRSAAAAISWELRRRHRWGFIVIAGYLVLIGIIKIFILQPRLDVEDIEMALIVVMPLTATFLYFLAVFSFGLSGDLAARQSMYPARMFTLPVTTNALVGWPMFYGTVAMALLWLATRLVAVWPHGSPVPVIWPALLAASLLAWTQALTWMPYALPGLRVIVAVLWLSSIDAVVLLALHFQAHEPVMVAILAPHVPLAFLAARFAVGRARRGDVPDWRRVLRADARSQRRRNFASADAAQVWFEGRQFGRSLPALVAIVLPFALSLLWVFKNTPELVFEIVASVLMTPPFMAAFVAATVSKSNPDGSDVHGLSPFTATRPLTTASLISAKLKAAIWSTAAAWILVIVAVPIAMRLSGTWPLLIEWTHDVVKIFGTPRAIALDLLVFFGLVIATWKQLVKSIYIGMSGRAWLVKGSVFVALAFLSVIVPLSHWIFSSKFLMAALWNTLPWILALLVCVKLAAAVRVAMRLHDQNLISDRALLVAFASWNVLVFALYGLLVWLLPELLFRHYFLALIAILAVPLARLSAAPLALAWNRHR